MMRTILNLLLEKLKRRIGILLSKDEKVIESLVQKLDKFQCEALSMNQVLLSLITATAALGKATTYPLKEYYCPGQIKF